MRTHRRLVTVAATTFLAFGLGACGISDDGPHPGLAAEVDGRSISVNDLGHLLDAVCISTTEDPKAQGTSRDVAESQLLKQWVSNQLVLAHGADKADAVKVGDLGLETIPGWRQMNDDEQKAVADYLELQVRSNQVLGTLAPGEAIAPADFDVTINPRFDFDVSQEAYAPADDQFQVPISQKLAVAYDGQLSVPVSKAANDALLLSSGAGQLTPDQVAELPDAQLCGKRPAPQAPGNQIPIPQR